MNALHITPDWQPSRSVRALVTNDPQNAGLPSEPRWLKQVHGPLVVGADDADEHTEADGAWTTTPGVVCA
ncbi:MAG: multi-copper polyphenol oxidoreductase, partial [Gammaproteobacteria bacterium]|nr:multi-copper polyphenol oxidoreductase [Gammaproteobacteria bacterium]